MRTPIAAAAVAVAASLILPEASAQLFGRKPATPAVAPADPDVARAQGPAAVTAAPANRPTLKPGEEVAPPEAVENLKPVVPLPTEPLEPYMLTRENGPFMVMAYEFKGPEAPRQALALVLELRKQHKLPAYILLPRKYPGRSMIRGVPPQTVAFVSRDDVGFPEIVRTLDDAAVLVGNEKTLKDSANLLKRVKALHPACVDGAPQMWHFRKGQGLSRAMMTTNPFVPAEMLYPQQKDVLIGRINDGPRNIRNCPGAYTLEVAKFSGRSTLDPENDSRFKGLMSAMKSPLATAADDAERLADSLSRDKEIQKTGCQPYVYHDRDSSRVMIGSFNSPTDPAAQKLHARLLELTYELNARKVTDSMIVPASNLTDLAPIKQQLQPGSAIRAN